MITLTSLGTGCILFILLRVKQLFLLLAFLFLTSACFSQTPFNLKELLQHTHADPIAFTRYVQAHNWQLKSRNVYEVGLIATDSFYNGNMILKKEYAYYAIRSIKGEGIWWAYQEKNKRKRNKAIAAYIKQRDQDWNNWRESSWTSIQLYNIPGSLAQNLLFQMSEMNHTGVECCFKPDIKDGEEKRFAIDNTYLLIITSHKKDTGMFYDFHISTPQSPPKAD